MVRAAYEVDQATQLPVWPWSPTGGAYCRNEKLRGNWARVVLTDAENTGMAANAALSKTSPVYTGPGVTLSGWPLVCQYLLKSAIKSRPLGLPTLAYTLW